MEDTSNGKLQTSKRSSAFLIVNLILCLSILGIISYYLFSAPLDAKTTLVHVSSKETLGSISEDLESKKIIRNANVLKVFVAVFSSDKQIPRGDYLFEGRIPVWNVAWQLARGKHNVEAIKVTFPEGTTNAQMAQILADKLTTFRKDIFLSDERSVQGYLFPDTYFFFSLTTTDEVLDEITSNFKKRTASIENLSQQKGKKFSDIITMASLVEREANGVTDAPIIAGILWKRMSINMPLQVDVARETYTMVGLPKGPINNPGLNSIKVSLEPTPSEYLFYLHDRTGMVHYAKTYAEHRANIAKYLK